MGKTIVITGAGSGFGALAARSLTTTEHRYAPLGSVQRMSTRARILEVAAGLVAESENGDFSTRAV
ncbi:MAG TPA: hypothetical protein VFH94_21835, partial [Streptomyces sp.]|nr:hypothetical protein [Streptomyces sp.]